MSRTLRNHPNPALAEKEIREAIENLRDVRDGLKYAGANRAADKVCTAIKSAEGALRHSERLTQHRIQAAHGLRVVKGGANG